MFYWILLNVESSLGKSNKENNKGTDFAGDMQKLEIKKYSSRGWECVRITWFPIAGSTSANSNSN